MQMATLFFEKCYSYDIYKNTKTITGLFPIIYILKGAIQILYLCCARRGCAQNYLDTAAPLCAIKEPLYLSS
jgi:hypothetical protein